MLIDKNLIIPEKVEHKEVGFGEELLKNILLSHFTNNERTWIEVLTNEQAEVLHHTHVEYDENHPNFQALMKVTDRRNT